MQRRLLLVQYQEAMWGLQVGTVGSGLVTLISLMHVLKLVGGTVRGVARTLPLAGGPSASPIAISFLERSCPLRPALPPVMLSWMPVCLCCVLLQCASRAASEWRTSLLFKARYQ
jgi:hypothetical protein